MSRSRSCDILYATWRYARVCSRPRGRRSCCPFQNWTTSLGDAIVAARRKQSPLEKSVSRITSRITTTHRDRASRLRVAITRATTGGSTSIVSTYRGPPVPSWPLAVAQCIGEVACAWRCGVAAGEDSSQKKVKNKKNRDQNMIVAAPQPIKPPENACFDHFACAVSPISAMIRVYNFAGGCTMVWCMCLPIARSMIMITRKVNSKSCIIDASKMHLFRFWVLKMRWVSCSDAQPGVSLVFWTEDDLHSK